MRKRFTRQIENFICDVCGTSVIGNGYTNHCPVCLSSKHVDIYPGDRSSDCLGIMIATSLEIKNNLCIITHTCLKCGHSRKNKAAQNDSQKALRALSQGKLAPYIQTLKGKTD